MIKVVVFDFDGTLVDSNGIKRRCMDAVVSGAPGGPQALAAARRRGGDRYRIFADVAQRLHPQANEEVVAARTRDLVGAYTRCCARGIVAAPEREKARRLMAGLRRRGLRVWLNSATPHEHLHELLQRRGLAPLLHGALGGPRSKADNLRRIMKAEKARAREVVMVGDGPDDEAGAHEVGAWFVALTRERRIAERGPFSLKDVERLAPLLHRLWPRPRRAGRGP